MTHETTLGLASAPQPTAESQSALADRPFLGRLALLYAALSLAMVLLLDRFWSANWDAQTFLDAARTFWDGGSLFDLYATSRATSPWPYAYPPLFALLLAPFVWLADGVTGGPASAWPQLVAMRFPILVADVAIAVQLHRILGRATGETWLARLGAALWLFNPILFYHTAVQAHLETLWLWPTLVAYTWVQERGEERAWWPALLLVLAIAVKQTAVLFALPFGLWLLLGRRWGEIARMAGFFLLLFGGSVLPFALHSDDFRFMVVEYVAQMPVQIQSWQVWTLALEGFRLEQTRTTFPTVRFALPITVALNALLSLYALRRGRSWYAIGLMVTLGFLLTAQKAIGYHYPILLPFLIAYGLRPRRFRLVGGILLWTGWVLVSPYFAPWAEPSRLPFYALLGTLNSLVYGWLLWRVARDDEEPPETVQPGERRAATQLVSWMVLLATAFALACLATPARALLLEQLAATPIPVRLAALGALLLALLVALLAALPRLSGWAVRVLALPVAAQRPRLTRAHVTLALLFLPIFFTWFTLRAEVTAVIERGVVEAWGLDD